ncbi:MAG: undecaprenyl-diphosphate phosphatase, partial [Clostridia bacterium]
MSIFQAIMYGLLQGATEFLPVSSSGHLYLLSALLSDSADVGFFIWLHVGTLFAVVAIYRKQIWYLITHPKDKRLHWLLLSSVPTFILAAAYKFLMPNTATPYLLPVGFALTMALLLFNGKHKEGTLSTKRMKWHRAIIVGVVQGCAVLPGLSRSGSTICALSLLDVKHEDAVEFSFLLSIPVIIGGAAVDIYETVKYQLQPTTLPLNILLGVIAAA